MSYDKTARAVTRHHAFRVIANRVELRKQYCFISDQAPGKWRKRHPMDCGRPHCMLCTNPRRTWGRVTLAELKANQAWELDMNGERWEDYTGFGESIGVGAGKEEDWI